MAACDDRLLGKGPMVAVDIANAVPHVFFVFTPQVTVQGLLRARANFFYAPQLGKTLVEGKTRSVGLFRFEPRVAVHRDEVFSAADLAIGYIKALDFICAPLWA